jgi:hypothetical protein
MLRSTRASALHAAIPSTAPSVASLGWLCAFDAKLLSADSDGRQFPSLKGNNAVQTDAAKKPKAGNFGCGGTSLLYDGVNDATPVDMSAIVGKTKLTYYAVYMRLAAGAGANIFETTTGFFSQNGIVLGNTTAGQPVVGQGAATSGNTRTFSEVLLGERVVIAGTLDRTVAGTIATRGFYQGIEPAAYGATNTTNPTGTFAVAAGSWIGARNNGTSAQFPGYVCFVGVRDGIDDDATVRRICATLACAWR